MVRLEIGDNLMLLLALVAIVVGGIILYTGLIEDERVLDSLERFEDRQLDVLEAAARLAMYDKDLSAKVRINGVYNSDGFYSVWTRNRSTEAIASTSDHEKCHALTAINYTHFCTSKHITIIGANQ